MSGRRGDGVYDAVVVGAGPNGLAAAVELALLSDDLIEREAPLSS